MVAVIVVEVKQVEQIADRRTVNRNVRIEKQRDRVREIIAAPVRERPQAPVALDELQNRDVIGVRVANVAAGAER